MTARGDEVGPAPAPATRRRPGAQHLPERRAGASAALGGSHSVAEPAVRLTLGRAWPAGEDRVLATAADEALVDAGLPPLGPSSSGR